MALEELEAPNHKICCICSRNAALLEQCKALTRNYEALEDAHSQRLGLLWNRTDTMINDYISQWSPRLGWAGQQLSLLGRHKSRISRFRSA